MVDNKDKPTAKKVSSPTISIKGWVFVEGKKHVFELKGPMPYGGHVICGPTPENDWIYMQGTAIVEGKEKVFELKGPMT
jgi:hypothetical protein